VTLTEKWADGVETLHGMHVHGFPNCFVITQAQSGFSANFPHMINEQSKHLAYIIAEARARQARVVEVSAEAEQAWVDEIVRLSIMRAPFLEACTPGYYNNEGNVRAMSAKNGSYGAGPVAFVKVLEKWREAGELEGLQLS
jgi:cyclohexanone monooxygenase